MTSKELTREIAKLKSSPAQLQLNSRVLQTSGSLYHRLPTSYSVPGADQSQLKSAKIMSSRKTQSPIILTIVKTNRGWSFLQEKSQRLPSQIQFKSLNIKEDCISQRIDQSIHIKQVGLIYRQQKALIQVSKQNQKYDYKQNNQDQVQTSHKQIYVQPQWFNLRQAHQQQKKYFPQFFKQGTTKSPQMYINYRNFIVSAYRTNPQQYLTKIACRKALIGDANIIMKIHQFLQRKTIINYQFGAYGLQHFQSSSTQPKLLKPYHAIPTTKPKIKSQQSQQLLLYSIRLFSKYLRPYCQSCKLTCNLNWFSSNKTAQNCIICHLCFKNLKPQQMKDYTKQDIVSKITQQQPNSKSTRNPWTIDQTIKLLQAITTIQDLTWQKLRQSLDKKRTQQEIILHFMQLPCANFRPSSIKQSDQQLNWSGLVLYQQDIIYLQAQIRSIMFIIIVEIKQLIIQLINEKMYIIMVKANGIQSIKSFKLELRCFKYLQINKLAKSFITIQKTIYWKIFQYIKIGLIRLIIKQFIKLYFIMIDTKKYFCGFLQLDNQNIKAIHFSYQINFDQSIICLSFFSKEVLLCKPVQSLPIVFVQQQDTLTLIVYPPRSLQLVLIVSSELVTHIFNHKNEITYIKKQQ